MRTHHDHTPLGILLFQTSVPRTAGEEACSTMAPVALPLPVAEDASALRIDQVARSCSRRWFCTLGGAHMSCCCLHDDITDIRSALYISTPIMISASSAKAAALHGMYSAQLLVKLVTLPPPARVLTSGRHGFEFVAQ